MMKTITLFGNCQTLSLNKIIPAIVSVGKINRVPINEPFSEDRDRIFNSSDIIIYQDVKDSVEILKPFSVKQIRIPQVLFRGFHPDCIYVNDRTIESPIVYHSLIVVASYLLGLTVEQCISLFNEKIYKNLDYLRVFDSEVLRLKRVLGGYAINQDLVDKWCMSGVFMHSVNHPKLYVLEDLIKAFLKAEDIQYRRINVSAVINDPLRNFPIYPVFFDHYSGKTINAEDLVFKSRNESFFDLEEFVRESYKIYETRNISSQQLGHHRFEGDGLKKIEEIFRKQLQKRESAGTTNHPYKDKPEYCFWRKSIAALPVGDVDPALNTGFSVASSEKIATAGSCFAQHISKRLSQMGFNYFVPEAPPSAMEAKEQVALGYGMFSCRYGNLYTPRQLLQLFMRAYGEFKPDIKPWMRPDGKYVDPFRPQITPDGYDTPEDVLKAQIPHLASVRQMFEQMDIFIFTLGLTECWEHISDGAILPLAPGVVAGKLDWDEYRFRNFKLEEVKRDLNIFLERISAINPNAKILLTVSPVPLMATFEDRHVLVSTTASKSILRVVADEVVRESDKVFYFPSFEIITGNFNRGAYYEDDLREIKQEGVDHVMRLFIKHCTHNSSSMNVNVPDLGADIVNDQEADSLSEVICDERLLDV